MSGPRPRAAARTSGGRRPTLRVRVYYEDTDFSGFVYHASYLRFMERGRTELLRGLAGDQSELHREADGLVFVVRRMSIDFLRPARMDDVLTIVTRTRELRGASMHLPRRSAATARFSWPRWSVACVRDGRAVRLPDALRHRSPPRTAVSLSPSGPDRLRAGAARRR